MKNNLNGVGIRIHDFHGPNKLGGIHRIGYCGAKSSPDAASMHHREPMGTIQPNMAVVQIHPSIKKLNRFT